MLDRFVMLLSTDWFKPHWNTIGVETDESQKDCIQHGAREVVRQIMSGIDEYWLASFAPERIEATRLKMDSILGNAPASARKVFEHWYRMTDEELRILNILYSLTADIYTGDAKVRASLDPETRQRVLAAFDLDAKGDIDFEDCSMNSRSQWDNYIKQVTPDLPTYLPDAVANFVRATTFREFWRLVQRVLDESQNRQLRSWYQSATSSRISLGSYLQIVN
jgi:hypothetical protein